MPHFELHDGRRVGASYDFKRDWWVAQLEGDDARVAEGRELYRVLMELLDTPSGEARFEAIEPLAAHETPLVVVFNAAAAAI